VKSGSDASDPNEYRRIAGTALEGCGDSQEMFVNQRTHAIYICAVFHKSRGNENADSRE